jgi:putative transposase
VKAGSVFFVTICCARRVDNQLCRAEVSSVLFEAVEFRQEKGSWHVHLLVGMPDHLHMLVSFPHDEEMKKAISNFKEITAKKASIEWQRDFFDHRLRSHESFDEKAHYIRMNPVRKGLVSRIEDWPYMWMPTDGAAGPAVPPYL